MATIDEADGSPDGMTIDTDGALWVALWGGGQVRRYLPDGELDEILDIDATNVSCCTFGPDGTLYITTARIDSPERPGDGAIFRATIDGESRVVTPHDRRVQP